MTATTTAVATEGAAEAVRRFSSMGGETLLERARRNRNHARDLRLRSATAQARACDLLALLEPRVARADAGTVRGRLVAAETRVANLERALVSNRRIGMALGVLMARHGLTEQQAFDLLRQQSSRRNVKLAELAEEVVYTGNL